MTLLLIDVGNTRIKWARLVGGRITRSHAAAHGGWSREQYARRLIGRSAPNRILVCSVAGGTVARRLIAAAKHAGAPAPEFMRSARRGGGVTTSYLEPWRLGVNRFAGVIGAHFYSGGRPCCVINVGTAITIDLVDAKGRHRGGAIVPGPDLMVQSLLSGTKGIRRRAKGGATGVHSLFARTTRVAIRQGAVYAAAAVIERSIEESARVLGSRPLVVVTGGGFVAVRALVREGGVFVAGLVLLGLAVWGGQPPLRQRLN